MKTDDYLKNPCVASSLPFWKAETVKIPEGIIIVRDDEFNVELCTVCEDEKYFKLIHDLADVTAPELQQDFEVVLCDIADYAAHINSCYAEEGVTTEELKGYMKHPTYDPDLWVVVADRTTAQIVATGIAELDTRIGEGILEWIQVSPQYRHKGLGKFVVRELLWRMKDKASFAVVSGKVDSESNPMALYRACGFINPVIWHVITEKNL